MQRRRDKAAAVKLMRKLLKKQGFAPEVLVTDKLRSYGAAKAGWDFGSPRAGLAQEQSGREFASANTAAGAQDAALQIARFSPALLSVHAAVHNTFNVQRHLTSRRHAPRPQRRSIPEMGSGYRCLSPSWPSKLCTANLSSCDSDLCTMGQVARGGARPTDPRSREACPLEMSMKSASRRTPVHPATLHYPIA